MDDSEIDNLGGVVSHHENVAGLQVAVNQSHLMGCLQSLADLDEDLDNAAQGKSGAGIGNQFGQSRALQQGHDAERLLLPVFLDHIDVADIDNVGMGNFRQGLPLLGEQLDRNRVGDVLHDFDGNETAGLDVEGAPDDAHTAFAELVL